MFDNSNRAFIAINDEAEVCLMPKMANRHGLITGITRTGNLQLFPLRKGTSETEGLFSNASDGLSVRHCLEEVRQSKNLSVQRLGSNVLALDSNILALN